MIDTIKFSIPHDGNLIEDIRRKGSRIQKVDSVGLTDELKVSDVISIPPYNRNVQLYLRDMPFGDPSLFLEYSIPKICYGTNAYLFILEDLPKMLGHLTHELNNRYLNFPVPSTWSVQRLDICHFWKFTSREIAQRHLDFIKYLDYPRKNKHIYRTTAMFSGRNFTARFYLKLPEYLKTDYKSLIREFPEMAEEVKIFCIGMLRFEVEIRKPELKRIYGREVMYKDLLNKDFYSTQLNYYLSKFNFPKYDPTLKKYDRFKKMFSVSVETMRLNQGHKPVIQAEL
jgi:hypothetical protein